jgi:hypothetical protein
MNTNANSVRTQTAVIAAASAFGQDSRIVSIAFGTPNPFGVALTRSCSRPAISRWPAVRRGEGWENLCYAAIWASGWAAVALAIL